MEEPGGALRPPNVEEREVLHGFRRGHTLPATKSGEAKSDPAWARSVRASQIGSSFQCELVAWLIGPWAVSCGYSKILPSLSSVRDSLDREDHVNVVRSSADTAPARDEEGGEPGLVRRLCLDMVRHADHRGSDVRISSGALFRPSVWPRQSVNPRLWRWKVAIACRWRWEGHINALEARGAVAMLKLRLRSSQRLTQKFVHLLDSQVSMGILTKKCPHLI